jgi:hypothetical protein
MASEVLRLQTRRLRAALESAERQLAVAQEALDVIEVEEGLVDEESGERIDD